MSRDRVQAFPIGADIRSPEVCTPSHRSSVNREVFDFAGTAQPIPSLVGEETAPERFAPRVDDQAHERLAQCATSSASSPEKDITTSNDARAVRDRQLRELLTSVGMTGRSSSSSTSAAKGVSYDGNRASGFTVAHVVAGETKPVAPPKTIESPESETQLKRLEREVEEMRIEMQKAQKAEQRLRADRDEWRMMAVNLQTSGCDDAEEEDDDHEEDDDDPSHDVHGGGSPSEFDGGDSGKGPPRKNRKGPGYDPSDGGDPDGGDDPEYTEVKISRREADKVVVPSFPTVTHLGKLDVPVHCQRSQRMCGS